MARSMSAQDMYIHLARELRNARTSECKTCRVPKPFWGPSAGPGSGYWYMETPSKCDSGCRQVVAKVWAQITTEYDIAPPPREAIISGSAYARSFPENRIAARARATAAKRSDPATLRIAAAT